MAKAKGKVGPPPQSRDKSELLIQSRSTTFSGPLPPPVILAQYNEIIPNGALRILAMAERQSVHREQIEARVVNGNVASQTRGSYFAFVLALISIIGGLFLIYTGKNTQGLVAIIGSLAALASVFVYSKYEQRKERERKFDALQSRKIGR